MESRFEDIDKHFRVAIFGSARIKEDDQAYQEVFNLANLIAKKGFDVVTGGGPGLMDAASRGHHEGRGTNDVHSIGLTIQLPKEQRDAYSLDIKRDFKHFSKRLDNFMHLSNVVVVAPGGIGTILEFFYTWQLVQVNHICTIPIILMGDMWDGLIEWIKKEPLGAQFLEKKDLQPLHLVHNCTDAFEIIEEYYEVLRKSDKVCINSEKYRIE